MSGHEDAADRDIQAALINSAGGLDLDTMSRAIAAGAQALHRQLDTLRKVRYRTRIVKAKCRGCNAVTEMVVRRPDPAELSRAAAHVGKTLDSMTRLVAFAKGQPDSRSETVHSFMRQFTDEQLTVLQGFVEENRRAGRR